MTENSKPKVLVVGHGHRGLRPLATFLDEEAFNDYKPELVNTTGIEKARNMILYIQEENDKPSVGTIGFTSPAEREKARLEKIKLKYGLTHGKGKKNKRKKR